MLGFGIGWLSSLMLMILMDLFQGLRNTSSFDFSGALSSLLFFTYAATAFTALCSHSSTSVSLPVLQQMVTPSA